MLRIRARLSILKKAVFLGVFIVISSGVHAQDIPKIPDIILTEEILDVTDSLSGSIVAAVDTHRIGFTTTITPLSDSAIIWVTFPAGFDITGISEINYFDDDGSNNGNEPQVSSWDNLGQTLKSYFSSGSQPAVAGSRISIEICEIINRTVTGDNTVNVFATDSLDNITHGPDVSAPFTLLPDELDHIIIFPESDTSVAAGSSIFFSANGYDQYNNIINGLTFSYAVTVDSCGDVVNAVFTADKLGDCYVTASSGGITDSSGLITVIPGPFDRFSINGTPPQRTAGQSFSNPVVVTVYDIRDNIKNDYSGIVWFESNDASATLPFDSGNPFSFPIDSAGVAAFAGGGFTLVTAGARIVTVTDGANSANSDPITVNAAQIASFELEAGPNQTAGQSFQLIVPYPTAVDQFGNLTSGTILISDSIGGGNSPGGVPPVLSAIMVTDGSGSAFQILTNAEPTVLKGSASGFVAATDTIMVAPGSINEFAMTGYPLTTTAGNTFPADVIVTAYDAFGNMKINYSDSVYFTSSDGQAVLHPGHRFIPSDSGSFAFNGSQFSLRSAGAQTITATDGSVSVISETINVVPGALFDFSFIEPPTVMSGIPFPLAITSAVDEWGNDANGVVTIDDSLGGGNSPNGTSPIFNAIQVVSGAGSANQTLFNAVPTVMKGTSGSTIVITDSIEVISGGLGEFDLDISSPQYNDSVFTGAADLTAFDQYGNIKTNYNASGDTVVITSSAGGTMQNNILKLPGDFTDGVADLMAKQTSYSGRGGLMTFSAISQSGIIGISGPVEMLAITCENIILDQGVASWNDTITGSIEVTNDGGAAVVITELDIFTEDEILFNPSSVSPILPAPVGAGQQQTFDVSFVIPYGMQIGTYPFSAAAFGAFSGVPVSDTLDGFPDTLEIQSSSIIGYVTGSISRDTLSRGNWYNLSLSLANTGGAGLALFDSSNIIVSDSVRLFRADISSGVFLPPNTPLGTTIIMDSAFVDPAFTPGVYQPVLYYYGEENGDFVSDTINLSDMITIQEGIDLQYITGSISIDSLVQGQNAAFSIRLSNNGDVAFVVDHENSRISFSDSNREYIAYSDTASSVRIDIIQPGGDTTFSFTPTILIPEFTPGDYLPVIKLRGTHNGLQETRQFNTSPDSVSVLTRGSLRIDSTYAMSRNVPFVNTSQACSVKVAVSNLGLEPVQSFYIKLESESSLDSIIIPNISGNATIAGIIPFITDPDPDSGLVFTSSLSGGQGAVSGLPPQLMQPLDNSTLLVIETPALLSLSPLVVTSPPAAMDDTVTINQLVTLSTSVSNLGMADIEGPQVITLDTGTSGFSFIDSANREFILDEDVFWELEAPGTPNDSAVLSVRFLNRPIDSNDGGDAVGPDSVSTRTFVANTEPIISHIPVVSAPDGAVDNVLSTGQSFTITDTITALGIFENLTASIALPASFSTSDPLSQTPVGGLVSWVIRAPDNPIVDSISVAAWLVDPNTGELISTETNFVVLDVLERATLNLASAIIGPRAALDGIIEPGASLQFEAVVHNLGQASAGEGVISLHLGHPDIQVAENPVQPFNSNVPLVWNITVPDSEIAVPVPIWTIIDFLPSDENTNAPAFILNDSSSVNITVRELLPEIVIEVTDLYRGSAVKGQELDFMTFRLRNRDRGGSFSAGISSIAFNAELNPSGEVEDVFTEIFLFSDSVQHVPDLISADTVGFVFDNPIVLEPGESAEFILRLVISSNASIRDFRIHLNTDNIKGFIMEDGIPTVPLVAVSPRGEREIIVSNYTVLLEQDFSQSVSSCPNPFNPRIEQARIVYNLTEDSDLEVKIFTLPGELVWSKSISASDPLGRAGPHTEFTDGILWDGRNDAGSEVRSGVYICLIKNNTSGEEEKFKIAVVK
ncbi:MAG: hypothetical protein JSU85_00120 [Candidatus Zixiibacteriota bacterium]|nr:MAG: hypothetical protein JSU85_00120 [candidate division Zixibacteria bacterium]